MLDHVRPWLFGAVALLGTATASAQQTFTFNSDPFAGSTALTTPGRQVVGGEPSITFNIGTDQFVFDPAFFDVGTTVNFGSGLVGSLPTSGLNVIVLQTTDDDANAGTPFGAGNAANLLAAQITSDGAGFFVYFNSGLNMPRLVYSTNLNEPVADLKILARMTNLLGNPSSFSQFSAANFQIAAVPEPGTWAMMLLGFGVIGLAVRNRRLSTGRRPAA
jgi:hypothetical protein